MGNNSYFHERMINDKLAELRAEGIRSQMLARAGLQNHRMFRFSELQRFIHQMLARVTRFSLRRIEQPGIRKNAAQ